MIFDELKKPLKENKKAENAAKKDLLAEKKKKDALIHDLKNHDGFKIFVKFLEDLERADLDFLAKTPKEPHYSLIGQGKYARVRTILEYLR